ncbi:hypothetical protein HK097_005233 [Rhizophlyctis rosea]|uniref:Zinc finger ZPR1-type domain-containing protein n=1 Tax=Rhizophlyctis rosea TaxID=64517 RepID=A0AAD5SF25_9FUNG|nr:hypothetical protein HK097_005233 [Rhizophlyctis rosea]
MADTTPQSEDPLFEPVNPDQQITEIESLCMNCEEQGTTRLLLTIIPHFREVVLMAFECPHCGYRNNEIQSATSVQELGVEHLIQISTKEDLSRQVVKSESASVKFEELDFEIPPGTQKGVLTTVEGLIQKSIEGLSQDQPLRKVMNEQLYTQIESVIQTLQSYTDNAQSFTLILNDPAGNSYIENLSEPQPDPKITVRRYKRTAEQCEMLGLQPEEEEDDFAFKEQVHSFAGTCSRCHADCETKMHMLDIPHFKEVIIWATNCEHCGYRSNEVKAGGAIALHGKRIILRLTDSEDLSRDILKSETAGLSIPEVELELHAGTLGGRFTTVEGLLTQVRDELQERAGPFVEGDSSEENRREAFGRFIGKLEKVLSMDGGPYTLILDDPLANSYIQNPYAPDEDPEMKVETYERSWEQNEFLGLNDIKLENYAEEAEGAEKGDGEQQS